MYRLWSAPTYPYWRPAMQGIEWVDASSGSFDQKSLKLVVVSDTCSFGYCLLTRAALCCHTVVSPGLPVQKNHPRLPLVPLPAAPPPPPDGASPPPPPPPPLGPAGPLELEPDPPEPQAASSIDRAMPALARAFPLRVARIFLSADNFWFPSCQQGLDPLRALPPGAA